MPTAWSCYTRASDELVDGGYGDVLGHRYEYDSNVVNHKAIGPPMLWWEAPEPRRT